MNTSIKFTAAGSNTMQSTSPSPTITGVVYAS
jgi:hypothetical protein